MNGEIPDFSLLLLGCQTPGHSSRYIVSWERLHLNPQVQLARVGLG